MQDRAPRVRYKVLQLAKTKGGLGLPNLKHYWLASQLRAMIVWLSDDTSTKWLSMEKSYSPDMALSAIPFNRVKPTRDPLGEWSNTTCVVWKEIHQMFKLTGDLSVLSSIIDIRYFLPLRLDTGFKNWKLLNLHYVHQLFSNNNFNHLNN